MGGRPRFDRFPVTGLGSVAHLFPQSARCGVYVLEFANGERYVGQSVDVVRRFGTHQRHHGDICFLQFRQYGRAELDLAERQMIDHQKTAGFLLRNIRYALGPVGECDLDPLVMPDEQHAWLTRSDSPGDDGAARADDPAQRQQRRAAYERLRATAAFPLVHQILHDYVQACLPQPAKTERTFWAVSALPQTGKTRDGYRLATVSVNKMECLFLYTRDQGRSCDGAVNVSLSGLTGAAGSLRKLTRRYHMLGFAQSSYESAGGDALGIWFTGIDGYHRIWAIPGAVSAARTLNLMLMRKGPTFQWRGHCYDLADCAFIAPGEGQHATRDREQ